MPGPVADREPLAHPAPAPGAGTVLVTGAGGAGRTTVAAATALAAARDGARTLLLTTADHGVLEAVLDAAPGTAYGARPVAVTAAPGLWAARADTDGDFRERAAAVQRHGRAVLELAGAEPLSADELTPLPGADTFALLHALRAAHSPGDSPAWDVVVVDLPPAPRALAALALPGQLRRYLRRLLPPEKRAARALRPVLAQLAGVPMPAEWLYGAAARVERELAAVQRVVDAPGTSVRLVAEPTGELAARALRTVRGGVALYGLRVDAVVANRVLPAGAEAEAGPEAGRGAGPGAWAAAYGARQRAALAELRAAAGGAPVTELPHLGREPRGPRDLAELPVPAPTGVPDDGSAGARPGDPVLGSVEDRLAAEGLLYWRLPLPGAERDAVGLVRHGDELAVTVGPYARRLPLPPALRRCRVTGAALADGELRVRCAPDARLWPRGDSGASDGDGPDGAG
ncbi:ArsA-related P-loop ATPase [Streptomyces sp. Z26]|uniref:ArsA family ATPase n=1 Tax=Streptomyces sp. Z26 TaxID=2500177 RepID=UPI000EF170ED|nr:ArsA family ATPase [Streptomyces sp. Z26]